MINMEEPKQAQIVPKIKERIDRNGRRWIQDHETNIANKAKST
jgi:hypothetical protein